jgi:four helix bundle protein
MTTIRKHEDITAWQLGQETSRESREILSRSPARSDRNYCSELQEAAGAISANIAEGFDRYRLPQFRYFLEIANASLGETSTRIRQGFPRRFFTEREFNELLLLCRRTRELLAPLIASVDEQGQGRGKDSTTSVPKDPTASAPRGPDRVSSFTHTCRAAE